MGFNERANEQVSELCRESTIEKFKHGSFARELTISTNLLHHNIKHEIVSRRHTHHKRRTVAKMNQIWDLENRASNRLLSSMISFLRLTRRVAAFTNPHQFRNASQNRKTSTRHPYRHCRLLPKPLNRDPKTPNRL